MSFTTHTPSGGGGCNCDPTSRLITNQVNGSAGDTLSFWQETIGAAFDSGGNAAWRLYMNYSGQSSGASGSLSVAFALYTDQGEYRYKGSASLSDLSRGTEGSYIYRYSGSYELISGPSADESVPRGGSLSAAMLWWGDRSTLYKAVIAI
jgi:hypothetical protein